MATTQAESETRPFLSIEDLAQRYGVSVGTVRDWRYRGVGPVVTKVGAAIRFALTDVLAWERQNREVSA